MSKPNERRFRPCPVAGLNPMRRPLSGCGRTRRDGQCGRKECWQRAGVTDARKKELNGFAIRPHEKIKRNVNPVIIPTLTLTEQITYEFHDTNIPIILQSDVPVALAVQASTEAAVAGPSSIGYPKSLPASRKAPRPAPWAWAN